MDGMASSHLSISASLTSHRHYDLMYCVKDNAFLVCNAANFCHLWFLARKKYCKESKKRLQDKNIQHCKKLQLHKRYYSSDLSKKDKYTFLLSKRLCRPLIIRMIRKQLDEINTVAEFVEISRIWLEAASDAVESAPVSPCYNNCSDGYKILIWKWVSFSSCDSTVLHISSYT